MKNANSWGLTPAELRKLRGLKTPHGIQRLLDDRELRRRMGAAAFSRVRETFTWTELAARYDSLYDELSDKP